MPIWLGLALYIHSWDFGAALPRLSHLHRKSPQSQLRYKNASRTQSKLDTFGFTRAPSTTQNTRPTVSSHAPASSPDTSDTDTRSMSFREWEVQTQSSDRPWLPSPNSNQEQFTMARTRSQQGGVKDLEGGGEPETDDEVVELIEGWEFSSMTHVDNVKDWPEIHRQLDKILAKEELKWVMPYHQVRIRHLLMW